MEETRLNREVVRVVERNFSRYKKDKDVRDGTGSIRYLY